MTCKCGAELKPSGRCARGHVQKANRVAKKPPRVRRVVQKVKAALVPPKGMTIKFYSGGELVDEVPIRWRTWDEAWARKPGS